ncbi:MAG: MFS transporter [Dehalococcoidia bacterium]|nr:MFS transporter [Dehalococcoidia bacterium]
MRLPTVFLPKTTLSRDETRRGLRVLTLEYMASTGFSSITSSAFLVAFALMLGANNFQIGILASIPLITDVFQIPAVWIVEKFRRRKIIVFTTWLVSQLLWVPIALLPMIIAIPGAAAISMLIGLMAVRGILNAFTNCGWSSWMRDLIPQKIIGRYFARRLSLATIVSIILGLGAAYFLDYWDAAGGGALGYSWVLLIGLVFFGLVSPAFTALVPEPRMLPLTGPRPPFRQTITTPLRDRNYRQLMKFLMFWGFASSMAFPFFEVFMLRDLNLSILIVIILATITEIFTAISLHFWGPLADRFGGKVVMSSSTSLFLLVLLGWSIVVIQGQSALLIPLLLILHVLEGIAMAGILLSEETLSLKLAPRSQATSYNSVASLADSAGTGIGVLAGGFMADFFTGHVLKLDLSWVAPLQGISLGEIQLTGFYFLFTLSFVLGLITLGTLQSVHEQGTARGEVVLRALFSEAAMDFGNVFPAPEVTRAAEFPFIYLNVIPQKDASWGPAACRSADLVTTLGEGLINKKCGIRKKPPPEAGET